MHVLPTGIVERNSTANGDFFNRQSLYDLHGHRKYVTEAERKLALAVARTHRPVIYTLFSTLAFSGCRLSEALEIDVSRVDFDQQSLIFRTLKKRHAAAFRLVPVPEELLQDLDQVHAIARRQSDEPVDSHRLWIWSRTHAWRVIKRILAEAGVRDAAASPKGLRHGFGVTAVTRGIPLHLVQRWLGHTQMTTTAIYADALGEEERQINARMWSH